MTTARVFPQELIDQVIQDIAELDEDVQSTLCTCSLVCSSFRDPAQKQLFNEIQFWLEIDEAFRNDTISQVLTSSPRLRQFVTAVVFFIPIDTFNFDASFRALPRLENMRELTFANMGPGENDFQWWTLPVGFRTDVREMFRWPNLACLRFQNVEGFVIGDLELYLRLAELEFHDVTFISDPPHSSDQMPDPQLPSDHGSIEALSLRGNVGEVDSLLYAMRSPSSVLSFLNLRKFELSICVDEDIVQWQTILNLGEPSALKDLTLVYHTPVSTDLHLSRLVSLERLSINAAVPGDAILHLPRLLETLPPKATKLAEIHVGTVLTDLESDSSGNSSTRPTAVLREIDGLLTGKRRDPPPPVVERVEMVMIKRGEVLDEEIRAFVAKAMPGLSAMMACPVVIMCDDGTPGGCHVLQVSRYFTLPAQS